MVPSEDIREDQRYLTSAERGFLVLDILSKNTGPLTLTELSEKANLAVPTVQRLVATLVSAGYVQKNQRTKRYNLTVRTVDLMYAYLSRNHLAKSSWPHLVRLREELGFDISLSVRLGDEMIYVHRLPGKYGSFENTLPGKRLPLHLSASGRCILAYMQDNDRRNYFESTELRKFTPNSIDDSEKILLKLDAISSDGYSLVEQEVSLGIMTLACPIFRSEQAVAGISVHAHTAATSSTDFIKTALPALLSVARSISDV